MNALVDISIILLSPLNSLFSEDNIRELARRAGGDNPSAQIYSMVFSDDPLSGNFLMMGYPNQAFTDAAGVKAADTDEGRAHKYGQQIINRAQRAVSDIPVLTWDDALKAAAYLDPMIGILEQERIAVQDGTISDFMQDCMDTSLPVIRRQAANFKKEQQYEAMLAVYPEGAAYYLHYELAGFSVMPYIIAAHDNIAPETINSVTCYYPNPWPVFEKFIAGDYGFGGYCPRLTGEDIALPHPEFVKKFRAGDMPELCDLKFKQLSLGDAAPREALKL